MQHEPPGGSFTSTPTACPCRPLPVWRLRYVREYSIYGCRDAKPIRDVFEPSVESSPVSCVVSHLAHSSVCSDSDETSRSPGLSALSSRLPRVSRPSRLVLVKRSHFSHAPVGCRLERGGGAADVISFDPRSGNLTRGQRMLTQVTHSTGKTQ